MTDETDDVEKEVKGPSGEVVDLFGLKDLVFGGCRGERWASA